MPPGAKREGYSLTVRACTDIEEAAQVSSDYQILADKFQVDAIEVYVDFVCEGRKALNRRCHGAIK
jgi:hypothetical protein